MALVTGPDRVTTDEFLAGPERPGVQLLDGEVFVNDATHLHQLLCRRVYDTILRWTDAPVGHGRVGWAATGC